MEFYNDIPLYFGNIQKYSCKNEFLPINYITLLDCMTSPGLIEYIVMSVISNHAKLKYKCIATICIIEDCYAHRYFSGQIK